MPSEPAAAVEAIVADVLGVESESFDDDSAFGTDIATDSLDVIEIAETVEFDIGVRVPDEALDDIETVGDLKRYVAERA